MTNGNTRAAILQASVRQGRGEVMTNLASFTLGAVVALSTTGVVPAQFTSSGQTGLTGGNGIQNTCGTLA